MQESPFKFLDAYQKGDKDKFFGRKLETETLYQMTFDTRLILVYGASGTGKTSLVQAGLANKFSPTRWKDIFLRRNADINISLETILNEELDRVRAKKKEDAFGIIEAIEKLYHRTLKPIYLIFDQFEELFISGTEEEQIKFYGIIAELLATDIQVKILLILREEWIAYLNEFEKVIPSLFENRVRIEKMTDQQLIEVVVGTIEKADIELIDPQNTVEAILTNLRDKSKGIELANLQIYLDKLFRNDQLRMKRTGRTRTRFDPELVAATRQLEDVLSDFLEEQLDQLEKELETEKNIKQKGIPLDILYTLVTDDGTKRSMLTKDLEDRFTNLNDGYQDEPIDDQLLEYCIRRFNELRIIRILS